MTAHSPSLMDFGSFQAISPDGRGEIGPKAWAQVAALLTLDLGVEVVPALVTNLEVTLGVNEAHRRAMETSPEAVLSETREAKRRQMLERSEQASRQKIRDPGMVAAIDAKAGELAAAVDGLPEGDSKHARRARKKADAGIRKLREELDELRAQELAQEQLYGAAAEPIFLARMRGEEVDAFEAETADFARDEHGAMTRHKRGTNRGMPVLVYDRALRAKKLDGIEYALANGQLSDGSMAPGRLYRAGVSYRDAYVIAEGQTSTSGEGGGGCGGPKAPQTRLIQAGEELADMRRHLTERQRRVLDEVCGLDGLIWKVAEMMGAGIPATERALRGGLAAAADGLEAGRQARKDEGGESSAERIQRAHRMISRAGRG